MRIAVAAFLVAAALLMGQRRPQASAPRTPPMPVIMTVRGTLKQLDKKLIILETPDTRTYMLRRSKKTAFLSGEKKIQAKDVEIESLVTVQMMEESDLKLTAISLNLDPEQPARRVRTR